MAGNIRPTAHKALLTLQYLTYHSRYVLPSRCLNHKRPLVPLETRNSMNQAIFTSQNRHYRSALSGPGLARGSTGKVVSLNGRSGELCGWGQRFSRSRYRGQGPDEESDSDDDGSDDEFGTYFKEDQDFPDTYKEIKKHMTSLRADTVLGGGLNLARKKVDDCFLESKLRINGQKVLKKSKQMHPGDYIDLITEMDDNSIKVKRVRVVKVGNKKSSKDRLLVYLRAWRGAVAIPRDEETKWAR